MAPVTMVVAGAGGRGTGYAAYAKERPEEARIVGVAEPRDFYREGLARAHGIPRENVFRTWTDLAARPRLADAVIIATQDRMHAAPAVAFARKGYHILLEKPMAPVERDCRRIVAAAKKARVLFAVCHVMRYTSYTRALKKVVDGGAIGEVVSLQHLEPVGHWHQAHSFVRGNWRNEAESSPMLLSKSCHDLDWIRHIVGRRCRRVSSFGSLVHFRKERRPEGAARRCLDCRVEKDCAYSAVALYLGMLRGGRKHWPLDVITTDLTEKGVRKALREGPYGRCVYACDNDVVDQQVVNMEFDGGATASFTMTAFTRGRNRETRLFGTKGEIEGDGDKLRIFDFLSGKTREVDTNAPDASILGGHGGGDFGLMRSFVTAVARKDPSLVLSGADESLETHLMVFAAERARRRGTVERIRGRF